MTGDQRVGHGTAADAQAPAHRVGVVRGAEPYVRMAVVGYLAQAVFVLCTLVLIITSSPVFMTQYPWNLASAAISLTLAAVWTRLGRKQMVSWFTAAGVVGGASAVIALIGSLGTIRIGSPGPSAAPAAYLIANEAGTIVYLIYFVTQLGAYYMASKVFQVRLFVYTACLLAISLVAPPIAAVVVESAAPHLIHGEAVTFMVVGSGLLFSTATSLTAMAGFFRLRKSTS